MRLQDLTIDVTRSAMEEAFNYAKAVPQDKLGWKPLDAGRSVIEICQELAKCPDWAYSIVGNAPGEPGEEAEAAERSEMTSWTTVEACEAAAKEKLGRFFELLKNLPDERLEETTELPYGPGGSMQTFKMSEMMAYPRWNANYHLGQIAYIQTLYGDKAMH